MAGATGSGAIWAAPAAWSVLAAVLLRLDRADPVVAVSAALLALLGVGLARAVAARRGGAGGRAAELLLAGGGVAWALADASWQRDVIALAVPAVASVLALVSVWDTTTPLARRRLAGLAGLAAAVLVGQGLVGAPWWGAKMVVVGICLAATGRLLAATAPPSLAAAAVVAAGVAVGPDHVAAWLLPPTVALARLALVRERTVAAAALGVAAAALPPPGLALAAGLIAGAAAAGRRPALLLAILPAAGVAALRLPPGLELVGAPAWAPLAAALPLSVAAVPLLLPAAVLGLARARLPALAALLVTVLLLPVAGGGPWAAAAAASAWLLALPQGRRASRAETATLPFTLGVGGALLLLAPWHGAPAALARPDLLLLGWTVALAASVAVPRPARLAWLLPLAAMPWTVPVEGVDRALAAGARLELASGGGGVALLAAASEAATPAPGSPVVAVGGLTPLRGGRDLPDAEHPAGRPLWLVAGRGRGAAVEQRGLAIRETGGGITLEVLAPVVIRAEALASWRERRLRLLGLLGGAATLLLLAHGAGRRARDGALALATGLAIAAATAVGCGVEPLALAAHRGIADLALAVAACCWCAVLPVLARRRFLAGAVLLVPLALAQPLLRHPAGDEVYHLELLQSAAEDHDLDLSDNLDPASPAEQAYAAHGDSLIHSPALALALLPGYLAGGHPGALALLALAMAGGAALVARRAEQLGASRRTVTAGWALAVATYPTITFATQIWPAAAGVLLVALGLHAAARDRVVGAAAAAAAAVVVKVRLGLVTLPVAAAAALRGRGRGLLIAGGALAAAAALVALVFGGPLGRNRLAMLLPDDAGQSALVAWGLLWDAAGGLAFSAPLWLLAAAALPRVWRRGGGGERALALGAALTVVALFDHPDWFGGGSPPARYLVPLLPLALLGLVLALTSAGGRRAARLLAAPAAILAWVAATRPLLLYHDGDPGWWLADGLAWAFGGAARNLFPSVLRPGLATVAVPLFLVLAVWWWSRRPRHGAAAVTLLAVALLAGWTAGGREWRVDAEDPQVRALGGAVEPPVGTMGRAAHTLSWRMGSGDAVAIPWRPPLGRRPVAVVRAQGHDPEARLEASWDDQPAVAVAVPTAPGWTELPLPAPPGLGRGELRLAWRSPAGSALLVDRVEVR